jgi:nucleoside-diphosphate-sugar epimerase
MKKILVTGASGFIGNSLVDQLLTEGYEVIPIARSIKPWSSEYIKEKLIKIDLSKEPLPDFGNIDCACLLASKQPHSEDIWNDYYKINSKQILKFIDKKINQLIYISSSSVNLLDSIPNPTNHYGLSKFVGEKLLEINKIYFKQSTVLRFPSVIGINHKNGIIHDLKSWIEKKMQIDLFDNGNKIRNILHVNDAVKSILLAIRSFSSLNEYEEFNIGSQDSITLAEITSSLIDLMSVETTVNLLDNSSKSEDVYIDNSEAVSKLGYAPITIRDGLKKYLKEYDYEI